MSAVISKKSNNNYLEIRKQQVQSITEKHSMKMFGHKNAEKREIRQKAKLIMSEHKQN